MSDPKQEIQALVSDIMDGRIPAEKAWQHIKGLKGKYVETYGQPSWNAYIGNRFQEIIHAMLKGYIKRLKDETSEFTGLEVLTASEVKADPIIMRKLVVQYGDFCLLPDVDSAIVWFDFKQPWESEIIAIASCKTSLRERIAQACYWKLKLVSSDVQKGIRLFLATADHDDDFNLKDGIERFDGKSRDRVISEYELDGIYILKEDFREDWESDKVKRFERIFRDIVKLTENRGNL
ncbi:MAG: restriction endonuclease [Chloroflexi bacterium]|nr:restriction endonuclease [Chloroflexota bacterium]